MALPHQFSWRAASMSERATRGFDPSLLLRIENMPCVPEAKWVVWLRHSDHCSDVAHAAVSIMTPPKNEASVSHARMGPCLLMVLRAAWIARPVMIRRGSGAVNFIC